MLNPRNERKVPRSELNGFHGPMSQEKPGAMDSWWGMRQKHILIPFRFDCRDRTGLMLALEIAAAYSGRVTLLHVLAPKDNATSVHWLDAIHKLHENPTHGKSSDVAGVEKTRADILQFIQREVPSEIWSVLELRAECRIGDPAAEIVRFADDQRIDLMLLCTQRPSWRPTLWPRLSQRILRQTKKPVLLVHPPHAQSTVSAER